jgi:hypothetical protein
MKIKGIDVLVCMRTLGDGRVFLHDASGQLPDVIALPPVDGKSELVDAVTLEPVGDHFNTTDEKAAITQLLKRSAEGDKRQYICGLSVPHGGENLA